MRSLKPSDIGHLHERGDCGDGTRVQAQVLAEMVAEVTPQKCQRAARPHTIGAISRASEVRLNLGDQHDHHNGDHGRYDDGEQHIAIVQLMLNRVAVNDDFLRLAHAVSLR